MAAFEDACAPAEGQLQCLEQALFEHFIVVLRMRQEDAAVRNGIAGAFLQLSPRVAQGLGFGAQVTRVGGLEHVCPSPA